MTLSHAITMLERLLAKHDHNRHRYAIELLAHVAVRNGEHQDQLIWPTPQDELIYREAYAEALARKRETRSG